MNKTKFSFYTLLAFYLFLSQQVLAQELPVCSDLPQGTRQLRVAIIPDTQGDDAEYGVAQKEITGIKNHMLSEVGDIDFVLHVGDVTNAKVSGVPSNEQEPKILDELQIFNDLFTQPLAEEGIPFYPIIGNHDYRKRGPWKVVFPYLFDNSDTHGAYIDPTTVPGGTSSNPNNSNYSYTVKDEGSNTYFVLLDAFNGGGYCNWLIESYENIRQESPDARIFSIQHMNLFALAAHSPLDNIVNPSANDTPQDFLNASTNYGIEGWFSGHNHYYHRAMYVDNDVNPVSFDYTVGSAAFKVYSNFEREPTDDHRVQFTKINRKPDGRYMANYQVMDIFEEFVVIKTYYSDEAANGAFSDFYLADEFIYSDNGAQTLIPSGTSFSTISDNIQGDTFVGTEMDIVEGINNDTRTFVAGNKTHNYTLNATTGWFPKDDWHEGKQDNIQSDVLVLRGLANGDNNRRTSPYLLKLSYDDTGMTLEQEKELDLISFLDFDLGDDNVGEWYLANYGTEVASEVTEKVVGAPVSNNTLGDFGVDTEENYVWAYIDYHGDFCVGTSDLELVEPVTIFKNTIIALGDTWNYVVNTVDDIDNWNKTTFDDSGWNSGPSPIGYNDPGLNTITPNALRVFMRKSVSLTDVEKIQKIEFGVDYDDGYVLYLNGNEIDRQRVDDDPVTNTSTANAAINHKDELVIRDLTNIAKQHLINGENIFSIAILNANSTSSDLSIYPEIYIYSENAPEPDDTSVAISSPANNASLEAATDFTLSVEASHPKGFEWMRLWVNSDLIEENVYELKNESPWEFNVSGLSPGTYTFYVRARDNDGGTTDSESITVTLTDDVTSNINSLAVNNVSISPNPVYDNGVRVEFGLKSLSKVSLSVLDMNGSIVSQPISNQSFEPGAHKLDVPLINISSGIYFIQITFDGVTQTHKLIVM